METENLKIDPELCKRLDRALWSTKTTPPQYAIDKAEVIHAELLAAIEKYDSKSAYIERTSGLFRLYTILEFFRTEWGKHDSERGHANMQTATNQLKNYK